MSHNSTYNYICVIDFEATCINNNNRKEFYPHEIIEFPCVLIDIRSLEIKSTFHAYVKPTLHPELSDFCKSLTGITQESIDNAETFESVLNHFVDFIREHVVEEESFVLLTDGSWDVSKFLALQCIISKIDFPLWANDWIDLKKIYEASRKKSKLKLVDMLHSYGLKFEGRLHSGKDDAYNIARLVMKMMKEGCKFFLNDSISNASIKYLRKNLSFYQKRKQEEKNHKKSKRKKTSHQSNVDVYVSKEMDIDPDLLGCESVLLKKKT